MHQMNNNSLCQVGNRKFAYMLFIDHNELKYTKKTCFINESLPDIFVSHSYTSFHTYRHFRIDFWVFFLFLCNSAGQPVMFCVRWIINASSRLPSARSSTAGNLTRKKSLTSLSYLIWISIALMPLAASVMPLCRPVWLTSLIRLQAW